MRDDFERWHHETYGWDSRCIPDRDLTTSNVDAIADRIKTWDACLASQSKLGPCGKGHPKSAWKRCDRCLGTGTVDGPFDKTPFTCTDCTGNGEHCRICQSEQWGWSEAIKAAKIEIAHECDKGWPLSPIARRDILMEAMDRLRTRKEV